MIAKLDDIIKLLQGYRKLSVMVSILIIAVVFRLYDYINGSEMVELLKVSATGFFAANLMSKVTSTINSKINKE